MSESSFDLGEGQEDLFAAMDGASLPDFADSGDMSQHYAVTFEFASQDSFHVACFEMKTSKLNATFD